MQVLNDVFKIFQAARTSLVGVVESGIGAGGERFISLMLKRSDA